MLTIIICIAVYALSFWHNWWWNSHYYYHPEGEGVRQVLSPNFIDIISTVVPGLNTIAFIITSTGSWKTGKAKSLSNFFKPRKPYK